ncbi:MAG TPA: hypothetical protein VM891_01205 [Amaricoccus sp.]|jgi:hypothetical protein|nr:hypothetical protein [Amaricoccus sp.]
MSAYNVVRMRAKPGRLDELLGYWGDRPLHAGMTGLTVVRTGDRDICLIGCWTGMEALVAARPAMIAELDRHRDKLEDLGRGRGVTDPVSGEAAVERRE